MSFSDSNRVGLLYVEESTWGVLVSSETMKALNFTSESLKGNINTVTSDTIRSDRNVSDITVVGGGAAGDIGFELRYNDIDDLLAGALNADWVTTQVSAAVASARFSAATIKCDSSAMHHLRSGMFFRVSNATTAGNDGDYQVATATFSGERATIICLEASSGTSTAFTGEGFGASTLAQGKHIRNGTTPKSYTVEKRFQDVSTFHEYAGMRVGSMSLDVASQSIMTGTMAFAGKGQAISTATIASAITPASTNDVMNASGNINRIWEGGQALTNAVFQNLTLELNNNTRDQPQVGSDDLAGIGLGRCEVTGSLTAYFEDNTYVNKFVNNTQSNIRFQVTDSAGNSYIFSVPKVRYTDSTTAAGGPNADVVQEMTWGAMVDDAGVYAIGIDALDA